jgi:hypothetical protein
VCQLHLLLLLLLQLQIEGLAVGDADYDVSTSWVHLHNQQQQQQQQQQPSMYRTVRYAVTYTRFRLLPCWIATYVYHTRTQVAVTKRHGGDVSQDVYKYSMLYVICDRECTLTSVRPIASLLNLDRRR